MYLNQYGHIYFVHLIRLGLLFHQIVYAENNILNNGYLSADVSLYSDHLIKYTGHNSEKGTWMYLPETQMKRVPQ